MEILDIVDENGQPTGQTADRKTVHSLGYKHRTSHLWILRKRNGETQVLLQKRSDDKDSFPGCYDVASAGHIPAGMGFKESAIREAKEELGLDVKEEELIFMGDIKIKGDCIFHGERFLDDQYSRIFYIIRDVETEDLTIQEEELSGVMWIALRELRQRADEKTINHCIYGKELDMVPDI